MFAFLQWNVSDPSLTSSCDNKTAERTVVEAAGIKRAIERLGYLSVCLYVLSRYDGRTDVDFYSHNSFFKPFNDYTTIANWLIRAALFLSNMNIILKTFIFL